MRRAILLVLFVAWSCASVPIQRHQPEPGETAPVLVEALAWITVGAALVLMATSRTEDCEP